ncbi:DUF3566 domain-containing protein [Ilumatobacter sp.]|uniref:DUF3566 domain-containing protein n=1 Tax=Ilumatobacter sp. TaxID=1967498 RepID=UPI003B51DC42
MRCGGPEPHAASTIGRVSKTERDLAASESAGALDDMFDDTSVDDAHRDAMAGAELDLDRRSRSGGEPSPRASRRSNPTPDHVAADAEADVVGPRDGGPDAARSGSADAPTRESSSSGTESSGAESSGAASSDIDRGSAIDDVVAVDHHESPVERRGRGRRGDDRPPVDRDGLHGDEVVGRDDRTDDEDPVPDEILEELRRADIDGPVVAHAPQDETTSARRRPRRSVDYDPAPVPIPAKVPRVLGRRPRVRRVTRVVRSVDPWSVFKIAIVAHLVLYVVVLTASVLLWNVANATGTVQNVERFFESFGWNTFEFDGGEIYHAGWIAGLFVVIGLTGLAVLAATVFNLITDLVGGVRFTVLEEEVVETRSSPMRRFVVRRPEPEVPAVLDDGSGPLVREAVVDDTGANERPTR